MTWESPQVENPLIVSCCCAEMRKCAIRDAVIKASAVMRCLFRDEDLRTPKCIVVESHGTLMKGVDSTEQRTSCRNADTCAATLLQRGSPCTSIHFVHGAFIGPLATRPWKSSKLARPDGAVAAQETNFRPRIVNFPRPRQIWCFRSPGVPMYPGPPCTYSMDQSMDMVNFSITHHHCIQRQQHCLCFLAICLWFFCGCLCFLQLPVFFVLTDCCVK